MKKTLLLGMLLLSAAMLFAQPNFSKHPKPYKVAIGGKYQPYAVSLKWYLKGGEALEFLGINHDIGYRLTTLYNFDWALTKSGLVRAVVGTGIHFGIWRNSKRNNYSKSVIFGGDAIFGIEARIPKTPINIQLDYQPSIDVAGNNEMHTNWGGVTLRWAFGKPWR